MNQTTVFHRSYHRNLDDALAAREDALERKAQRPLFPPTLDSADAQLAEITDQPASIEEGMPVMSQLLTVNRFIELYFEEGSRPTKFTVWRWIRNGLLSAQKVGRSYYIHTDDASRFIEQMRAQTA